MRRQSRLYGPLCLADVFSGRTPCQHGLCDAVRHDRRRLTTGRSYRVDRSLFCRRSATSFPTRRIVARFAPGLGVVGCDPTIAVALTSISRRAQAPDGKRVAWAMWSCRSATRKYGVTERHRHIHRLCSPSPLPHRHNVLWHGLSDIFAATLVRSFGFRCKTVVPKVLTTFAAV